MYELFARVTNVPGGGGIKRIIMGLDRNTKTPCGFAFVKYVCVTRWNFSTKNWDLLFYFAQILYTRRGC